MTNCTQELGQGHEEHDPLSLGPITGILTRCKPPVGNQADLGTHIGAVAMNLPKQILTCNSH